MDDDVKLEHIKNEYGSGRMMTGEIKKEVIEVLTKIVTEHQERRKLVTDELVG
jgi:tryptophanyl-tRNA synthetase